MKPDVSIIIPHYKTFDLVRLCLRSIRRYTETAYEVVVVDNDSGDEASLQYLRRVKWIRLIERREGLSPNPSQSHKEAMDIGIAASAAPYVLSFHTDTIPIRRGWLGFLLRHILSGEKTAAVGSYKLEIKSPLGLFLKRVERRLGLGTKKEAGTSENPLYIRSHCALYRREILDRLNLHFASDEPAGRNIHFGLIEAGYEAKILPPQELLAYVVHLNHATMALHPQLGARKRTIRKGLARIKSFLARPEVERILNDESLDR